MVKAMHSVKSESVVPKAIECVVVTAAAAIAVGVTNKATDSE